MIKKPSKEIIKDTAITCATLGLIGSAPAGFFVAIDIFELGSIDGSVVILPAAIIGAISGGFIGFHVGRFIGYIIGRIIYYIAYIYYGDISPPTPTPIPTPTPPPTTPPPSQRRTTTTPQNIIGRNCPYCQFPFKQGASVIFCPSCEVPHHQDCWGENSGCTTYGCSSSPR